MLALATDAGTRSIALCSPCWISADAPTPARSNCSEVSSLRSARLWSDGACCGGSTSRPTIRCCHRQPRAARPHPPRDLGEPPSRSVDCALASPAACCARCAAAPRQARHEDSLRGLPRLRVVCLVGGFGAALVLRVLLQDPATEMYGSVIRGPDPFGMPLHLRVVDLRELGVLFAGGVGGAGQGGAQQRRSGLAHGLALAVGVAGLEGSGGQLGVGAEVPGGGEPGGATHDRDQDRGADQGEAGQAAGQPPGVGPAVGLLAGLAVAGDLGLGGAQQPDLADDLVGQIENGIAG